MRKLFIAIILLSFSLDWAQAHAFLNSASPAVGAVLATSPSEIVLNFTEALEAGLCSVEVRDGGGVRVDANDLHAGSGNAKRLVIGLRHLAAGTYKVIWHALSVDTHRTEGSFTFTVAP